MGSDTLVAPVLAALLGISPAATSGTAFVLAPPPAASRPLSTTPEHQRQVLHYWTLDRMARATGVETAGTPSATNRGGLWPQRGTVRSTIGKVFFTLNGRDFLCSAATVVSTNRDLVVTAGHCAKNGGGGWADNWIFVPGYRDGVGPAGGFTARRMFVPDQWSSTGDDDYDVAMVALATSDGKHVTDAVGAHQISFEQPRGRQAYSFGYPASGRYNGERLAYCSGRPHGDPHGVTSAQGLRCDMTQGSSGGPWLSRFDPGTGSGVITSVSSFKYADDGTTMYGPSFGPSVRRLYDQAQRA
ncbi:MAG: trypsin-like peptidase domain-containing protein [Streptosporangiaceae bacterium]